MPNPCSAFADHFETADLAEAARYALAKQRMVVDNGNTDGLGHDCLFITGGKRAANSSSDNIICSYDTMVVAWPWTKVPIARK